MESNKGMTIISLLVYIIVLTVVIGTISILMKYFYKNENETIIQKNTSDQYTRFIAYLTDDINSGKLQNLEISSANINLIFNDGTTHKYEYSNKKIYYIVLSQDGEDVKTDKYIELCSNVDGCTFTNNVEKIITTSITIGGITYTNNFTVK